MAKTAAQKVFNMTGGWIDPAYIYNHGAISEKFINAKQKAAGFFSKENIEGIKKKIQSAIEYAAGVFERMDLEEIQFLIMRFCELLQNIEQLFFSVTSEMSAMMGNYAAVHSLLKGSGDLATAEALAAGATRYDSASQYSGIQRAYEVPPAGPVSSSPMAPPGSQIPEDARGVPGHVAPPTPEELLEVPTYEEMINGSSPYLKWQTNSHEMGSLRWTGVQATEKVMLIRLAKELNSKLTINSAYRSPAYNAKTPGASATSVHMSGKAFDITMRGMGFSKDTFINTARRVGFQGIGWYPSQNFVHIDTGGVVKYWVR
jgi:hypothetical protein